MEPSLDFFQNKFNKSPLMQYLFFHWEHLLPSKNRPSWWQGLQTVLLDSMQHLLQFPDQTKPRKADCLWYPLTTPSCSNLLLSKSSLENKDFSEELELDPSDPHMCSLWSQTPLLPFVSSTKLFLNTTSLLLVWGYVGLNYITHYVTFLPCSVPTM